jgi:hypothetical protein
LQRRTREGKKEGGGARTGTRVGVGRSFIEVGKKSAAVPSRTWLSGASDQRLYQEESDRGRLREQAGLGQEGMVVCRVRMGFFSSSSSFFSEFFSYSFSCRIILGRNKRGLWKEFKTCSNK